MWLPASDAYQMSPPGVTVMPYGPRPSASSKTSISPVAGSSRPYTPDWPVNHSVPDVSKTAVLRFTSGRSAGRSNARTSSVSPSTRTIALRPPSVIHAASSGPVITPCGADPDPNGISRMSSVAGSKWPSTPLCCPVYQTPPSAAGATSWGCEPAGTANSRSSRVTGPTAAGDERGTVLDVGVDGEAVEVADGEADGAADV